MQAGGFSPQDISGISHIGIYLLRSSSSSGISFQPVPVYPAAFAYILKNSWKLRRTESGRNALFSYHINQKLLDSYFMGRFIRHWRLTNKVKDNDAVFCPVSIKLFLRGLV